MHYMTIIDAMSGYQNLKLNKNPLYLTMFACQFSRYRFTRLSIGVAPAGGEILKDLPNIFGIADDILIIGYDADGKDCDKTLRQVTPICCQENLKQK